MSSGTKQTLSRFIDLSKGEEDSYASNAVRSSRYTIWTFLPKNLLEQFKRVANIWFLLVSIFQLMALGNTTSTNWTTISPLLLLLLIALAKDAYQDYRCYQSDKIINSREYEVWNGRKYGSVPSEKIRVGNFVLLKDGHTAPADVLVVSCASAEHRCFIDASSYLGDFNLKEKKAVKEIDQAVRSFDMETAVNHIKNLAGTVKVGEPNPDFNVLEGTVKLPRSPKAAQLEIDHFIPRGAVLRVVPWAIGLVIYAGEDTKALLNSIKPRKKISSIERQVNTWVCYILCGLLVLVICFSLCSMFVSTTEYSSTDFPTRFVVFCLLYNSIIPISLFVSMDIIRAAQVYVMQHDVDMNGKVEFKCLDLNEDLGQVEYVFAEPSAFTDRTPGVNVIAIGDEEFWKGADDEQYEAPLPSKNASREVPSMDHRVVTEEARTILTTEPAPEPQTFDRLRQICASGAGTLYQNFFECLALCTGIIPNEDNSFCSASQEDEVMVQTIRDIGCDLEKRSLTRCQVNMFGEIRSYEVLSYWESTPTTKRTRVIVKVAQQNTGIFYVKGTLAAMGNVLGGSSSDYKRIEKSVNSMGMQGLTPIIAAYTELSEEKLASLQSKFDSAKLAVADVKEKVNKVFEELEEEEIVKYLGLVGISSATQEDAKNTIEAFGDAGIKVWLLSSDSDIATLASAYDSGLVKQDENIVHLKGIHNHIMLQKELVLSIYYCIDCSEKPLSYRNRTLSLAGGLQAGVNNKRLNEMRRMSLSGTSKTTIDLKYIPENLKYCVSIDSSTFQLAMGSNECRRLLTYLLFCASSVCFNSLQPLQKSSVVKFVKENFSFHPVILAIGKDTSGMSMVQQADVGVAVRDKNKLAENMSDIVVDRFAVLQALVLKQGQWNYRRMCRTVLLFLFKNILMVVLLVWYTLIDDYTGSGLMDTGLAACFNVFFTSLPIIYTAVFDQHISAKEIMELPRTYQQGVFQKQLNWKHLLRYILSAIVQALVLVGLLYPATIPVLTDGYTETSVSLGTLFFIALVIVANVQTTVDTDNYTLYFLGVNALCIGMLFFYLGVASSFSDFELFDVLWAIFNAGTFVMSLFLGPLGCFVVVYALHAYTRIFYPTILDRYRSGVVDQMKTCTAFLYPRLAQFQEHIKKVYAPSTIEESNDEVDPYAVNQYTLHFKSKYIEARYEKKFIKSHIFLTRGLLVVMWLLTVLWVLIDATDSSASYVTYRVVLSFIFLCFLFSTFTRFFKMYYEKLTLGAILLGLVIKIIAEFMYSRIGGPAAAMIPMITYTLINVDFISITGLNILNIILFTISGAYVASDDAPGDGALTMLCYEVLLMGLTVVAGRAGYILEQANRTEYKIRSNTQKEVEKSRNILSLLLPSFVIARVRDRKDGKYIAEDQGNVTIIFCDIYDFDTLCSLYKPQELTAFLDDVFQHFDSLCQMNGVAKIETVGKTYMACSGLKYVDADLPRDMQSVSHARRAVEFAFDLLRAASGYKIKNGDSLRLKIGINSGPVISGVVGYHKPQFSLVGDTVNTASRMCSTIDTVNTIQISSNTRTAMDEQVGITFLPKTVYAKGKGDMLAYVISEDDCIDLSPMPKELGIPPSFIFPRKSSILNNSQTVEMTRNRDQERTEIAGKRRMGGNWNPFCPLISLRETPEEANLRLDICHKIRPILYLNLPATIGTQVSLFILRIIQLGVGSEMACWEVVLAYGLLALFPIGYLLTPSRVIENRLYPVILLVWCVAVDILILFDFIFKTTYDPDLVAMQVMFLFLLTTWSGVSYFKASSVLAVLCVVAWIVMFKYVGDWSEHLVLLLFIIAYGVINNYSLYTRERQVHLHTELKRIEEQEINKNEKLLAQMMPRSVYEQLKQDKPVTDKLRNMSILFADIVGFTNWSSDKTPEQVVGMLSALFTQFDMLCVRHRIYKVHTIGDCYVVMGFDGASMLPPDPTMGCLRVLCMGHEMIRCIREVNEREGISLNMRIGIHTGDVIAGITGKDVIRYDIYGSSVMVANKMESGGSAGKVNVSEVTREVLERVAPGLLEYSNNQEIEAKGIKKKYMSYFVKVLDEQKLVELAAES